MAVKDSGKRQEFEGGMVRDVEEGKVDYSLVFDGPMFERWAAHLTEGAKKYDKRNWMKGCGKPVQDRFKTSAVRHFVQWLRGDTDEDHAAAVMFNLNGYEYAKPKEYPLVPYEYIGGLPEKVACTHDQPCSKCAAATANYKAGGWVETL